MVSIQSLFTIHPVKLKNIYVSNVQTFLPSFWSLTEYKHITHFLFAFHNKHHQCVSHFISIFF